MAEVTSQQEESGKSTKLQWSRDRSVMVAIIGALATVIVAYIQFGPKTKEQPKQSIAGVVRGKSNIGIERATLTLKVGGETRILHSVEQGSFLFPNVSTLEGTLTAYADGYNVLTQNLTSDTATQFVEIHLIPIADQQVGTPQIGSSQTVYSPPSTTVKDDFPTDSSSVPRPWRARAEANIGWSYEIGEGGVTDYNQAMKWYQKAVSDGDAIANWNIARLYEFGFGVSKDLNAAHDWYQKAVDKGYSDAEDSLKHLGSNKHY